MYESVEITVFRTHIEIYPYKEGQCQQLERSLSTYDYVCHKWKRVAYYIQDNILYIPRGVSRSYLYRLFNVEPIDAPRFDPMKPMEKASPLKEAKSDIQQDAMDFLLSRERFSIHSKQPQMSLNLDTGDGKTYAAIYAALTYGYKTIIITHANTIKSQWIDSLENMTDIDMNRVLILDTNTLEVLMAQDTNKSDDYDIYLVNHQTILSYAKSYGWNKVREFFKRYYIGIKIIDEAHKFFENSFMIDCFSNTYKTFYLTATFLRNDKKENYIYNVCYSQTIRFGQETFDYASKRKHIVAIIVPFMSSPDYGETISVRTKRGFSVYKYIDYELNESNNTLIKILFKLMRESERLEGKRLILVPKKETIDLVAELVKERYPDKSVGKIYSDNSDKENDKSKEKDIIISTAKSSGTGLDIHGLRIVYNLEPIASQGYIDQVRGRVREYSKDKDTFFYYPVDTSIPDCVDMLNRVLPVFKRKCKEVIIYKIEHI